MINFTMPNTIRAYEIREKIKIVSYQYDEKTGALVLYEYKDKTITFLANPILLANKLKEYGFIDGWIIHNGTLEVRYLLKRNTEIFDRFKFTVNKVIDTFDEYIESFTNEDWKNFLVCYELKNLK